MYDLGHYAIPKATARFRPRADADLLSRAVQNAWELYHQRVMAQAAELQVAEKLLVRIKERFPLADMQVLDRYGCARLITSTGVRLYDPVTTRWDSTTEVQLPEAVMIPDRYGHIFSTGPYWSEEPLLGLKQSYYDTKTPEELEEYRRSHKASEEAYVPRDTLPYFDEILKAQHAYKAEYRRAVAWPADIKSIKGEWPTWTEIEEFFPILGGYMATLRTPQAQKAAA
ncbi:hypothetical protein [Methylobacterium ajmalii]|uniref:hypothetical protein n=1 Tax=Methylobacterium ajmalii TaxID=2738439 RepID=UPI002F352ECD